MARAPRRLKPKDRFYRCARCRSLVPTMYHACGSCGNVRKTSWEDKFIADAMRKFPGSYIERE